MGDVLQRPGVVAVGKQAACAREPALDGVSHAQRGWTARGHRLPGARNRAALLRARMARCSRSAVGVHIIARHHRAVSSRGIIARHHRAAAPITAAYRGLDDRQARENARS